MSLIMMYLSQIYRESVVDAWWMEKNMAQVPTYFPIKSMKNMEIGLKWVHMAR